MIKYCSFVIVAFILVCCRSKRNADEITKAKYDANVIRNYYDAYNKKYTSIPNAVDLPAYIVKLGGADYRSSGWRFHDQGDDYIASKRSIKHKGEEFDVALERSGNIVVKSR